MDEFKRNKTKKVVLFILLLIPVVLTIITVSYAFFQSSGEVEEEKITITSGTLSLTFRDNDDTVENIEGIWNFGDTIEKELIIENTGTRDVYAKISWDNLINTYLAESLTYTLEEKTDETGSTWTTVETEGTNVPRSETISTQVLADYLFIKAGHTYTYRLRVTLEHLEEIEQSSDLTANFVTKFAIEETVKPHPLKRLILDAKTEKPNFAEPSTADETADGLFKMEDDYGISYYFRGTSENNYVKFGIDEVGREMWWRIIRINGDGSIRIQYDGTGGKGTTTYTRGFALRNQIWNFSYDDAKYVGWMFGGNNGPSSRDQAQTNETNSDIKIAVDNWYKINIVDTGYSNYIADAIFCNDRSTPGKDSTGYDLDTGFGYGQNPTAYGAYARVLKDQSNPQPQFTCPQENDKFTVEVKNGGNGALTYPVGLITIDEIIAAGGSYNIINTSYYLLKSSTYWSMSPYQMTRASAKIFAEGDGGISNIATNREYSVAPVINLKPEYLNQLKGQGTLESPYYLS